MKLIIRFISEVSIIAIDEAVLAYEPSSDVKSKNEDFGEPIPVVYIKRKPHPNGLEIFMACSYLKHPVKSDKKIPFIVDMLPHLQVGDYSPVKAAQTFISR